MDARHESISQRLLGQLLTDDDVVLGNRRSCTRMRELDCLPISRWSLPSTADVLSRSRRTMGEVCSILAVIDGWLQRPPADRSAKTIRQRRSAARSDDLYQPCDSFLVDEPILRDLLYGIPTEHDLYEVACTVNRLVFFYIIIRWINLELREPS